MIHLRIALIATLSLPLITSSAAAQPRSGTPGPGTARIQVQDVTGHPRHARGRLTGATGGGAVETDSVGALVLKDLALGHYSLTLTDPGFATQLVEFDVRSQTPISRDVILTPGSVSTSINVISTSPIGNLDVPVSDIPLPVQSLTAQTLENTNAIDVTDALKRRLNGVYVNENQNNPFQPDVNYRGYTASPLVGAPAGLSVYLDGVRQNQPFGDVVQWDLIPKIALSTIELIPGSNPVYGLNTLGGALAVQTKNGISDHGFMVSPYGGSFGRRGVDASYGGSHSEWDWFAAGTLFHEDGWRVQSPSSVKQSFARLGYTHNNTQVSLSGGYAINNLTGNGTQDIRAINRTNGPNHGYNSVYSIPDATFQHQPFLTLNATQVLNPSVSVNLNAYVRFTHTSTTNGDINDDSFDQSLYTLSATDKTYLTQAGIPYDNSLTYTAANTPYPSLRCLGEALALTHGVTSAEPAEKCDGVATDTLTRQYSYGVSGAISWNTARNKFSFGVGFDRGVLTFVQNSQWAYLNPDGISLTRVPAFDDGSEVGDGGTLDDNRVNLHGVTTTPSFYATDTFSWNRWTFSVGGRYNHTDINNFDRLPKAPANGRPGITADNQYQRLNPSAGAVYKVSTAIQAYGNYAESSRAPTSTELGCSNPAFPCSLPNALVSDPPLKQVVSRTYEFGFRGNAEGHYRYSAGYFHSNNYDDLLFVASQQTGFGYFQNFGKTRRQGVETSVDAHFNKVEAGIRYTFLDATYQSSQIVGSGSNSANTNALLGFKGVPDGGNITISPGDRIPQVPQHIGKVFADYHPISKLSIGADLQAIGSSYVKGNDNNLHQPDGQYYFGPGQVGGYAVVNLSTRYAFTSHFEIFAELNNLLNRKYYTTGQLSTSPYDANGNFIARPYAPYVAKLDGDTAYPQVNTTFVSPGAPFTAFGGLKFTF